MHTCALEHIDTFNQGIYQPALSSFLGKLVSLRTAYNWDFTIIFDGQSPPEKAPEHARRQKSKKDGDKSIIITPLFVGMCIRVCLRYYFKYVVAPFEADVQVGRQSESTIAVARDSDLIAYGNEQVLIVDS